MTSKEFYNAVIAANLSTEINEKAKALLAQVESKNARSTKTSAANRAKNLEIGKALFGCLDTEIPYTTDTILNFAANTIKELEEEFGFHMNGSKFVAIAKVCEQEGIIKIIKGSPNGYIIL